MTILKTILGIALAAGLLFLIWKFLRWIILALVIAGLLLAGYYIKFHHWPAVLTGGLLHK